MDTIMLVLFKLLLLINYKLLFHGMRLGKWCCFQLIFSHLGENKVKKNPLAFGIVPFPRRRKR